MSSLNTLATKNTSTTGAETAQVTCYCWGPYVNSKNSKVIVTVPRSYFPAHRPVKSICLPSPAAGKKVVNTVDQCSTPSSKSSRPSTPPFSFEGGLSSSGRSTNGTNTPRGEPHRPVSPETGDMIPAAPAAIFVPPTSLQRLPAHPPPLHSGTPSSTCVPAAAVPIPQEAVDANLLLRLVLAQPCDARVVSKVHSLSHGEVSALIELLLSTPETAKNLIFRERGNVVVQLFSIPAAVEFHDQLRALFGIVSEVFPQAAIDKNGALAMTRLYDAVPVNSFFRHELDALTITNIEHLIFHRYGNFLVSHMVKTMKSASMDNRKLLAAVYSNPATFLKFAMDKSAAHTAEVWSTNATPVEFATAVRNIVEARDVIGQLAHNSVSNNPLQRLLARLYQDSQSYWNSTQGSHQQQLASGAAAPTSGSEDIIIAKLFNEMRAEITSQSRGACFERMVGATLAGRGRAMSNNNNNNNYSDPAAQQHVGRRGSGRGPY